jgi:adenylosuccinate synthase
MVRKSAQAVIGAGYGDEGKGLMTDFLASSGRSVVVRFNGGAQAGHTVTTDSGHRHVFHHFGAGAIAGAPTHLSQFFVANPMMFFEESLSLQGRANTRVSCSPLGAVTTPYDMMINQIVELSRGDGRHGSCGLGIGETEERNLYPNYRLTVDQLLKPASLLATLLRSIRDEWVPTRLANLGIAQVPSVFSRALRDEAVIERFVEDCVRFVQLVEVMDDRYLPDDLLFEGAQGLLLDQDYGSFPHVTRSNTGLKNIASIARQAAITDLDVVYATRAYVTRHGAGPLAHAAFDMSWLSMIDLTNEPNQWQGTIRTAPLDLAVLSDAIHHDLGLAGDLRLRASVAVTCLDQINDTGVLKDQDRSIVTSAKDIPGIVATSLQLPVGFTSWGPTRKDIVRN